jgi:hypothetical protein
MAILLVGLDQFHDLMLNVVERLRVARWPVLGPALGSIVRQVQIVGDPIDVQIEKYLGAGPIRMLGLAQQAQ